MTGRHVAPYGHRVAAPSCETCGAPAMVEWHTQVIVESVTVDGHPTLHPVASRFWCDAHAPSTTPEEFMKLELDELRRLDQLSDGERPGA